MTENFSIRPASRDEFAIAVEWAAREGWNPGLDDLSALHNVDPEGFMMGWIDEKPVSSISVVRYGKTLGFLGFYIVHPDHRGIGVGIATWNVGMTHLEGRTIALDGVVDQQENYKKSGFDYAGRNIRFTGKPTGLSKAATSENVVPVTTDLLPSLFELDHHCFPAPRHNFIRDWCDPRSPTRRHSLAMICDGVLSGFGTIRQCRSGYKIGPLFCKSPTIAETLFLALVKETPEGSEITLDVPEANSDAMQLAEHFSLESVFETARMVRHQSGSVPKTIDWNLVYGISTFELG